MLEFQRETGFPWLGTHSRAFDHRLFAAQKLLFAAQSLWLSRPVVSSLRQEWACNV